MPNFNILNVIKPGQIVAQLPSGGGGGEDGGIGELFEGFKGLMGGMSGGNPAGASQPNPQAFNGANSNFQGSAGMSRPVINNSNSYGSNFNKPSLQQNNITNALHDPYKQAQSMLGLKEMDPTLKTYLRRANPNLDPTTTPWCAGFVGSVLNSSGLKGTGSLMAKSYLNFGTPTNQPKMGDIVVLNRGNDPKLGHVGFFSGYDQNGNVRVLGGNQDNSVSIKSFAPGVIAGYRAIPSGQQVKSFAQSNGIKTPMQMMQIPKQVSSPTHPELQGTMAGIAYVESQGSKNPYGLMSKPTGNDRAYGKYQIMGKNIPSWTEEAGVGRMTPQQFLANPEAQERTAAYHINQNLNKYGNRDDAYSVWFSGRPAQKAGNAKDVYGTTVPSYIKKANQGYLMYQEQQGQQQQSQDDGPRMRMTLNDEGSLFPNQGPGFVHIPKNINPPPTPTKGAINIPPQSLAMGSNFNDQQDPATLPVSADGINWGILQALQQQNSGGLYG